MKTLIEKFSQEHRLKISRENDEIVIPGRQGQIYERDEDQLAVMFLPPSTKTDPAGRWCPKIWGNFKRAAAELPGMKVVQNGESEGCLEFDHRNRLHVKLAIRIAKVRPKRQVSDTQRAAFMERMAKGRLNEISAL